MVEKRLNPYWDFEDLGELGIFSEKDLLEIRAVLNDVMMGGKPQKIYSESMDFEIFIWKTGAITITNKVTGDIVPNKIRKYR